MANVDKWKRPGRPAVWRCDYLDAGGVRRRKTFQSRELADLFMADRIKEERQHLTPVMDPNITVQAYADHWLRKLRAKQGTVETYRKHVELYVTPKIG